MALSIGVSVGSQIRIGRHKLKVEDAIRGKMIAVRVDGKPYTITDQCSVEVAPEVFVSYGAPRGKGASFNGLRLALEAPTSMKIVRMDDALGK